MTTAALVSCGRAKVSDRSVAWKLYDSSQFEKFWAAGSSVGVPFVMSAEHGLVAADDRLDPYDTSLHSFTAQERKHWGREVVRELYRRFDVIVLFGGRKYVDPIKDAIDFFEHDVEVYDPFQYAAGNGQQQAIAGRLVEARRLGGSLEESIEKATEPYRGGGT